jgi:titin
VIAPGADELLLQNGGGTRKASGTSFAAPHAAGVAAIFISDRLGKGQLPPPAAVKQALITTGECYATGASAGKVFHDNLGCPQIWPYDRDTLAEPLVRADNVVTYAGDGSRPSAPNTLAATTTSSSRIDLTWVDNSTNEDGFAIERCTGSDCTDFAQIVTVGANVTTYTDTGLQASTPYSYRVLAYNAAGDSDYSNTALATTENESLPAAPTSLAATATSSSQINLSWVDNSDNESGFKIERCSDSGCTSFAQIATVGANGTTYSNTGLTASTTYSYRVRAYNGVGDSGYSNAASATTLSAPPNAPSNLTATGASSSQINLSWVDNSTNESGFKIERCQGASCSNWTPIATLGANVKTYSDSGLSASTTYSYRVLAYSAAGNSGYSNAASATTQSVPLTAPSNLTATGASSSQINLAWTDNATNETGFKIERCKGSTCTSFTQITTVGVNVTTYSNTGLTRNTSYRYRVRAYNAAGDSAYSNIAAAKTSR